MYTYDEVRRWVGLYPKAESSRRREACVAALLRDACDGERSERARSDARLSRNWASGAADASSDGRTPLRRAVAYRSGGDGDGFAGMTLPAGTPTAAAAAVRAAAQGVKSSSESKVQSVVRVPSTHTNKLYFCPISKVANTELKSLVRRIGGMHGWG